jgi:hypothetical protein
MHAIQSNGKADVNEKLSASRTELRQLLGDDEERRNFPEEFPRSKTVRALTSPGGLALLAVAAAGVLLSQPTLRRRMLSIVPASALLRGLASRLMTGR